MNEAVHNILAYGAVGDGKTLNTAAIQDAVDTCATAGGGKVVVPAGVFVSGPVFLKSNIEFHLSPGAVLRGSRNMEDYPRLDVEGHGYHIDHWHASLLTASKAENVSITGSGVLDGQGDVWWAARDEGRLKHNRPVVIYLFDCERVRIEGIKAMDSPSWTILPVLCRNVSIHGVTIKNPWMPYFNCDGINLHSCNNVRITDCYVDTGDDGICLKCLPEWYVGSNDETDYSLPHIPCENIVIANCVVEHAHGGVTLGAEVIGGIRNVTVSNCVFLGSRAGIRIYRYPWPGGYVENVRVDNVIMRQVAWVFFVGSHHDPDKMEDGPGREDTPAYRNIHFSNITATQAQVACELRGLPKMPIRDISFSNVRIESDMGFDLRDAKDVLLDNVSVECRGMPLSARDVGNLEVRRFRFPTPPAADPAIQLSNVTGAWIHGCVTEPDTGVFVGLVGEENRGVLLEGNRLAEAAQEQAQVEPANAWNICSHAYSDARWIRDTGVRNTWLPVSAAVMDVLRREWVQDQIDRIFSVSRVEPNARPGAEVDDSSERRHMYIIEADGVEERLVIFEDGEILRRINDPDFHAHTWVGM